MGGVEDAVTAGGPGADALAAEIAHSEKLAIRAHGDDGQATVVFDLTGSWKAVKIIADVCDWSLAPPVHEDKEKP